MFSFNICFLKINNLNLLLYLVIANFTRLVRIIEEQLNNILPVSCLDLDLSHFSRKLVIKSNLM